ncbi:MAG: hypothetical protein Q9163_003858 [Psora crenata]
MTATKTKATGHSQSDTPKVPKTTASRPHSHSNRRKHKAKSTIELPSTPSPTDSNAGTPNTEASPHKRVKLEAFESQNEDRSPAVESTYNTIIFVYINSASGQDFGIHKGLLCKASPIFKAALTEGHTTTDDLIIIYPGPEPETEPERNAIFLLLPNEDVSVFTRFNRWLYSKELTLEGETLADLSWADLISLYLFATKMKVTHLQNKCIDSTILKYFGHHRHHPPHHSPASCPPFLPNADTMNRLWRQDTNAAPLRQLFLHLYAREADLATAMALPGSFHAGFMKGLVTELYAIKEGAGAAGGGDGHIMKRKNKKEKKTEAEAVFWKKRTHYYVNDESNPLVLG